MQNSDKITIGSRGSRLALWQAETVQAMLKKYNPTLDVVIKIIKTTGDKIQDIPLTEVGGKGLFVKEIEEALIDKSIDLAVHSMKDMPWGLPDGLVIRSVLRREEPMDAFVSTKFSFFEIPPKAAIGTGSARRASQLLAYNRNIQIGNLRGNVDTRLRKLDEGLFDGIILASAGLIRLGLGDRIRDKIPTRIMTPAANQGIVGIEVREADSYIGGLVGMLNDPVTMEVYLAERGFLVTLEGGCKVPLAAHAIHDGEEIEITGLVSSMDGKRIVKDVIRGPRTSPYKLGEMLAANILKKGGDVIMKEIYGEK